MMHLTDFANRKGSVLKHSLNQGIEFVHLWSQNTNILMSKDCWEEATFAMVGVCACFLQFKLNDKDE